MATAGAAPGATKPYDERNGFDRHRQSRRRDAAAEFAFGDDKERRNSREQQPLHERTGKCAWLEHGAEVMPTDQLREPGDDNRAGRADNDRSGRSGQRGQPGGQPQPGENRERTHRGTDVGGFVDERQGTGAVERVAEQRRPHTDEGGDRHACAHGASVGPSQPVWLTDGRPCESRSSVTGAKTKPWNCAKYMSSGETPSRDDCV